jgi:hypothetical protein
LRNQLLRKELLIVLCPEFWFWFLSFRLLSLLVCGSLGYHHNTEAGCVASVAVAAAGGSRAASALHRSVEAATGRRCGGGGCVVLQR